jgi:hypothetical protein
MSFLKKYKRGIRNKYVKGLSLPEVMAKDITITAAEWARLLKSGFKSRTMLAYPHFPSRKSTLYAICNILNINVTNKTDRKFQHAIFWEYTTFREEYKEMEKINETIPVINLNMRDISKKYVDEHFEKVFGYSTKVDPLSFEGKCVKKNNINGVHDGEIINCPTVLKDENYIYQKLIDNKLDDGTFEDIRVPIIGGRIPLLFIRYVGQQFKYPVRVGVEKPSDMFSGEEIVKIRKFCTSMKLEYGELDVLRDKADGKIYIVDVNDTPIAPHKYMTRVAFMKPMKELAKAFYEEFICKQDA